jgi:dUTP pyrophosphatase
MISQTPSMPAAHLAVPGVLRSYEAGQGGAFQFVQLDERITELGQLRRGSANSAGYDLQVYPQSPVTIEPGEQAFLPLGFKLWINSPGIVGLVFPRSGLGIKNGINLANTVGVIDADYQGEWMLALVNRGRQPYTVEVGARVAQVVFTPFAAPTHFRQVEAFAGDTARGGGGFGSTGVQ